MRIGEPSPYAVLMTCLQKNYDYGQQNVEQNLVPRKNKKNEFTMKVNGQEVALKKNEKITLSSSSPLDQVTAYWSNDNAVVINTPHNRVQHQGKTVIVEEKTSADGSHCGLCGDYNQDRRADLKSPKGCIFKSRTLLAKSYRSKSAECSPLSQRTQEQIR